MFQSRKKYLAYVLIIFSVLVYGIYTGVQKQGLRVVSNPISFAFYTTCYCLLFLFPLALVSFFKTKQRKQIFNKSNLTAFCSVAFLSQFAATIIKLKALSLVNATTVGFMTSFSPLILSIFAVIFLKEKLNKNFFIAMLLMSVGLTLFKYEGGRFNFTLGWGEILTLIFISLSALSSTIVKISTNKHVSPFIISFGRMLFAIPMLGLAVYFGEGFNFNHLFSFWPFMAGLLFSARISSLYGGVSLIKLSNVAIFNVFAPLITFAYSFIVFGEKLNLIQMLGASIILAGAYLMASIKQKKIGMLNKILVLAGLKRNPLKPRPLNV